MSYRHNFLVFIIFVVVKLKRGEQIAIERLGVCGDL